MLIVNGKSKGVTLVELSIVLAVLGILIIVGISGRGLIDISRATATIKQLSDRDLSFQIFLSTYDCLPGDCSMTTVAGSNGMLATTGIGDGDTKIEAYASSSTPNEIAFVEEHLVKAQLFNRSIGTVTAGTTQSGTQNLLSGILPIAKVPGAYFSVMNIGTIGTYSIIGGASSTENVLNGLAISYPGIFKIIDSKIDDANGTSGNVVCQGADITSAITTLSGTSYASATKCAFVVKMNI